jgi:hypothetical protein
MTQASVDEDAFARFDASKARVRREIREGFFDAEGRLRMSEEEVFHWVGERALDELKIVLELSYILSRAGHQLAIGHVGDIAEQIRDESTHYRILHDILPPDVQRQISVRAESMRDDLERDGEWLRLRAMIDSGDAYAALLDINVVHEGYSAAAIEVLAALPIASVRQAYETIGEDEARHHANGRGLYAWLLAREGRGAEIPAQLSAAHERVGRASMAWSWPRSASDSVIEQAHERSQRTSMAWSWPRNAAGAVMEHAHDRSRGTSMSWSWPRQAGADDAAE